MGGGAAERGLAIVSASPGVVLPVGSIGAGALRRAQLAIVITAMIAALALPCAPLASGASTRSAGSPLAFCTTLRTTPVDYEKTCLVDLSRCEKTARPAAKAPCVLGYERLWAHERR